jgi:hypothetical protein
MAPSSTTHGSVSNCMPRRRELASAAVRSLRGHSATARAQASGPHRRRDGRRAPHTPCATPPSQSMPRYIDRRSWGSTAFVRPVPFSSDRQELPGARTNSVSLAGSSCAIAPTGLHLHPAESKLRPAQRAVVKEVGDAVCQVDRARENTRRRTRSDSEGNALKRRVWLDFVEDSDLLGGQRRVLTLVDECTRE